MRERVMKALETQGPLTGAELREAVGAEGFGLWKSCILSKGVTVKRVGRRYLRLDRKVEGYARLSPSILREFLTYCVIGLDTDHTSLKARTAELAAHIAQVSAAKTRLAERIVETVGQKVGGSYPGSERDYCILLGGDIVYGMGHDAPRSERSTGQMVKGSDIDLVVITVDEAPESLGGALDEAIYHEKYRHLNNPAFKEEIDYVVKPLARVREQIAFDTFKHMVSCKILNEAVLVYGSQGLHETVRQLLTERAIPERLLDMERTATEARAHAEGRLLEIEDAGLVGDELYLFHTSEESEEFE